MGRVGVPRRRFVACNGLSGRFLQFVSKLREVDDRSGNQVQLARDVGVCMHSNSLLARAFDSPANMSMGLEEA